LDILKLTQVLPLNAPSCGLITQTDAERLCASLLQLRYRGQLRTVNSIGINQYERLYSIKVQHKCFGKCSGTLYPTLYVAPQAECIQCDACQALFSPKTFVSHGHKSEENRICHWGFNSDNWRAYLKIRSTEDAKAREELELFKEKFLNNNNNSNTNQAPKKRLSQPAVSFDRIFVCLKFFFSGDVFRIV
jgi:Ski-like protein